MATPKIREHRVRRIQCQIGEGIIDPNLITIFKPGNELCPFSFKSVYMGNELFSFVECLVQDRISDFQFLDVFRIWTKRLPEPFYKNKTGQIDNRAIPILKKVSDLFAFLPQHRHSKESFLACVEEQTWPDEFVETYGDLAGYPEGMMNLSKFIRDMKQILLSYYGWITQHAEHQLKAAAMLKYLIFKNNDTRLHFAYKYLFGDSTVEEIATATCRIIWIRYNNNPPTDVVDMYLSFVALCVSQQHIFETHGHDDVKKFFMKTRKYLSRELTDDTYTNRESILACLKSTSTTHPSFAYRLRCAQMLDERNNQGIYKPYEYAKKFALQRARHVSFDGDLIGKNVELFYEKSVDETWYKELFGADQELRKIDGKEEKQKKRKPKSHLFRTKSKTIIKSSKQKHKQKSAHATVNKLAEFKKKLEQKKISQKRKRNHESKPERTSKRKRTE